MKTYRIQIKPQTAFGSNILGETLFGQLCWAYRHLFTEDALNKALENYTKGEPFLVVSDAYPSGYLPLPTVPQKYFKDSNLDRKLLKKKIWLKKTDFKTNLKDLRDKAISDVELNKELEKELGLSEQEKIQTQYKHVHATINRLTNTTTADGMFKPFSTTETFYSSKHTFDIYIVTTSDDKILSKENLIKLLEFVGLSGYGKDASVGLGKFEISKIEEIENKVKSNSVMTLSSCALNHENVLIDKTFYKTKTHFGRHGDFVACSDNPFKKPIILAKSGALISFKEEYTLPYFGVGIGNISNSQANAVHQGYAPVIGINSDFGK